MESVRVGDLLVHVWPGSRPDVPYAIAAHGITANGLSWARVADLLDGEVALVAPDLRGRAGSRDAAGPYGIARHGDDLVRVLDELGVAKALFAGHSMGAFVAEQAAVRHRTRATGVVLVDGGFAFGVPEGPDVDAVLAAFLGPAMARLDMEFPTRDAYREYWQAHPAFAGEWPPWVDAYIQHDLIGDGPFRSSCVVEAVRTDGGQLLTDPDTLAAVHALPSNAVMLYAERGLLNEPQAMYDEQRLIGAPIPVVLVPDTNHYSILVGDIGAKAIADHLRDRSRRAG